MKKRYGGQSDNRSFYEKNPHIAREQQLQRARDNQERINLANTDWSQFHQRKDIISGEVYKLIEELKDKVKFSINYNAIHNTLNKSEPLREELKKISQKVISFMGNESEQARSKLKALEEEGRNIMFQLYYVYKDAKVYSNVPTDINLIFDSQGKKMLSYTIYDFMRDNDILPVAEQNQQIIEPVNNIQQDGIEDEAMINELKNQLTQIKAQIEQQANKLAEKDQAIAEKDNVIAEKDNVIAEKDNVIAEKDNVIAEKDGIILEEQNKNIIVTQELQNQKEINQSLQEENQVLKDLNSDLTEQLASSKEANVMLQEQVGNLTEEKLEITNKFNASEEKNIDLQNKLDVSNTLVIPLKERVEELKDYKKSLENDKIELREFNKMLVDDKKMLQEEKKLLLTDKKHFQDLTLEQNIKITELSQIKCNDPNHYEIIDSNVMGQLPINNQINDLE